MKLWSQNSWKECYCLLRTPKNWKPHDRRGTRHFLNETNSTRWRRRNKWWWWYGSIDFTGRYQRTKLFLQNSRLGTQGFLSKKRSWLVGVYDGNFLFILRFVPTTSPMVQQIRYVLVVHWVWVGHKGFHSLKQMLSGFVVFRGARISRHGLRHDLAEGY